MRPQGLPLLGVMLATVSSAATVGPAFDVAPQAPIGVGQLEPVIAFDGVDTFLVVWTSGWEGRRDEQDLKAARVRSDGTVLDPAGLTVCGAPGAQQRPTVALVGGRWLVVWQDLRNGTDYDLYGTSVTAEGQVGNTDGKLLAGGVGNQASPSMASNGTTALLAWTTADATVGDYNIAVGRFDAELASLDGDGVRLVNPIPGRPAFEPKVSWANGAWAVVWSQHNWEWYSFGLLRLQFLSPELAPLGEARQLPGVRSHHHSLASQDETVLVAYSSNFYGRGASVPLTAARFKPDAGEALPQPNAPYPDLPGVARDRYIALTPGGAGVRHAVASASGGIYLIVTFSRLVWSGPDFQPYDQTKFRPNFEIYASRVRASDGLALDGTEFAARPLSISLGTGLPQNSPTVCGGLNGRFLVAYVVDRGLDQTRIEARFVEAL